MEQELLENTVVRVSNVSIIANSVLTLFKLFAGIIAHSGAMISDAVHSASDVLSSFIVIIGVKLSVKDPDAEHPYGHERFECVTAIVLAIILCVTGLFIGHTAIEKLTGGNGSKMIQPGVFALIAAVISIVVKEVMYRYTRFYAEKIESTALIAEAWHHRSDALSSIGALIGIAGARMGYIWMEPVASLVICVFIVKAAYDIFKKAVTKMVDRSCSPDLKERVSTYTLLQDGVKGIKKITGREFGNRIYLEIDVLADEDIKLKDSFLIQETVHKAIEKEFPEVKHIVVRVLPLLPEDRDMVLCRKSI